MTLSHRARQVLGWFACLAILLGLVSPTITQALPRVAGAGEWVTLCTAVGMKRVRLDAAGGLVAAAQPGERGLAAGAGAGVADAAPTATADGDGGMDGGMAGGSHCAYCCGANPAPALPAPTPEGLTLPVVFATRPALFWQAPRLPAIWAAAQPRGPPLSH